MEPSHTCAPGSTFGWRIFVLTQDAILIRIYFDNLRMLRPPAVFTSLPRTGSCGSAIAMGTTPHNGKNRKTRLHRDISAKFCIAGRSGIILPCIHDTLAEWSKALASGAAPQGHGRVRFPVAEFACCKSCVAFHHTPLLLLPKIPRP